MPKEMPVNTASSRSCYCDAVRRSSLAPIRRFVSTRVLAGALFIGATGCHDGAVAAHPTNGGDVATVSPNTLEDGRFASAAHELLRDGKATPERAARLSSVVRKQLEHAGALFTRGQDVRGANGVLGAFFLLRSGEARGALVDAKSLPALDGAIRRFSARGEEGRTLALLGLKRGLVSPGSPEGRELNAHVEALRTWTQETRTGGPMQLLNAEQKQAVSRALFEPTDDNVTTAARAVSKWIERAVEINVAFQETRQMPERDEAIEAFRALQCGAYVMAALYLRQGRAAESLAAVEASSASRITRPSFFSKLRAAASEGRADDWRMLARELGQVGSDTEAEEGPLDPEVLDAALFGVALEAYRLDRTSLAIAHLLANQLVEHEMPEVAPLVLADALGTEPTAASLSGALELVAEALGTDVNEGSVESARRVFAASAPLFALADSPRYEGQLRTTAAELRQRMGGLELRADNAGAARKLMVEALRAEPTAWGMTSLATLERQLGDPRAALESAERAFHLVPKDEPDLDAANARYLSFELLRDAHSEDAARQALDDALRVVLALRASAGASELAARAETLLARIFDGYGEHERGARAMERALDLADHHRSVLPQTMLAAIARALTARDLSSARVALGLGIKADTDRDSLVYGALWVSALERLVGEASDGKVDRVLADAVNGDGWTARLARWAGGSLSDVELEKAARSHADRVEVAFYLALRARAANAADSEARLKKLSENPLVDLFEVRLARDLRAPQLHLALPKGLKLP